MYIAPKQADDIYNLGWFNTKVTLKKKNKSWPPFYQCLVPYNNMLRVKWSWSLAVFYRSSSSQYADRVEAADDTRSELFTLYRSYTFSRFSFHQFSAWCSPNRLRLKKVKFGNWQEFKTSENLQKDTGSSGNAATQDSTSTRMLKVLVLLNQRLMQASFL